jgi:hypothetical protein
MEREVETIHHKITIWCASGHPPYLSAEMARRLSDYLVNFLKSAEGERMLRTLGYVREAPAAQTAQQ